MFVGEVGLVKEPQSMVSPTSEKSHRAGCHARGMDSNHVAPPLSKCWKGVIGRDSVARGVVRVLVPAAGP